MRHASAIRDRLGLPDIKQFAPELTDVPRWQVALSLSVPWMCLAIYVLAAVQGWWPIAVAGVVLLSFFTYGSVSHDLVHRNLGLGRRTNDLLLCVTELLAIRSGHAYQAAHLHHHARFPSDDDVEGAASVMTLTRSIGEGFILQPKLYFWAMRQHRRQTAYLLFEGVACVVLVALSVVAMQWTLIPLVYVALVIAGSWVIPLVTSYIPHHVERSEKGELLAKPDDATPGHTRLFRGWVLSVVAIEHLYHLEHHLYPQVPHHHWATLARKLDPYFQKAGVRPIQLGVRREGQMCDDSDA